MKVPEPRKLKSGKWFIQLRLGPDKKSYPITADTKRACKIEAERVKAEHRAGEKVARPAEITLGQAIMRYIEDRENVLSPMTVRGYYTILQNRFQPYMKKRLSDISNWQRICSDETKLCSAKTLKNAWGLVSSVLKDNGLPVPAIRLPQVVTKELPWLEPGQILQFVAAIKGEPCEIPALIELHGLRRSEMAALTWDESIDLDGGWIKVSGAVVPDIDNNLVKKPTNKNKSSQRMVPIMIPALREALEAEEHKQGPILKFHPNTIGHMVNRICKREGLPLVGNHGLRRSFASLAYHLGWTEAYTMEVGGWSDMRTMRSIYIKLAQKDRAKQSETMELFFKSANQSANEIQKIL